MQQNLKMWHQSPIFQVVFCSSSDFAYIILLQSSFCATGKPSSHVKAQPNSSQYFKIKDYSLGGWLFLYPKKFSK